MINLKPPTIANESFKEVEELVIGEVCNLKNSMNYQEILQHNMK
jgi:hypothetical protein